MQVKIVGMRSVPRKPTEATMIGMKLGHGVLSYLLLLVNLVVNLCFSKNSKNLFSYIVSKNCELK
jgi:hypothetical protein